MEEGIAICNDVSRHLLYAHPSPCRPLASLLFTCAVRADILRKDHGAAPLYLYSPSDLRVHLPTKLGALAALGSDMAAIVTLLQQRRVAEVQEEEDESRLCRKREAAGVNVARAEPYM